MDLYRSWHILTSITDNLINEIITDSTSEIIKFSQNKFSDFLLRRAIIFLEGVPKRGVNFRAPDGLHRAGWRRPYTYLRFIYFEISLNYLRKKNLELIKFANLWWKFRFTTGIKHNLFVLLLETTYCSWITLKNTKI